MNTASVDIIFLKLIIPHIDLTKRLWLYTICMVHPCWYIYLLCFSSNQNRFTVYNSVLL